MTVAEFSGGYGGLVVIEHRIDGETIATPYAHMWENGIHATVGEHVIAGQHIGDVGSSGHSTGPRPHFEVRPGGTNAEAVDAAKWSVLDLSLRPSDLCRDLNRTDRLGGPCEQPATTKLHTQIRRQLEARLKASG